MTNEQKCENASVEVEGRGVVKLRVEQNSENARLDVARRSVVKLITFEQKFAEKDRVEGERRSVLRLITVEHGAKRVRIETE